MCGIAGFTHRTGRQNSGLIRGIVASLRHRGPDQEGVWESPEVSLGAVRLKIQDLTGGDQPLVSACGSAIIAFNGETYNYPELRRELEARGHVFRTHCDTEAVLAGFLEWDTGILERLRGMFGLAIWSKADRRLILARDRIGIKPVYFRRHQGEIYFGSELKAILAHRALDATLDLEALDQYLSVNYVPGSRTLVAGIEKLPPGHFLEWTEKGVRVEAYWKLELKPDASIQLADATAELDRLLNDSVREHLVSDVPLGVWSSGGLDSSTVLHYAARHGRLKTFSVGFPGRSFDETPYFREIAGRFGTDHHEFAMNPGEELLDAIGQFAYYSDEPNADAGALPVWFLSRMTRQHVTVALSGDGGDELFGGYITYQAERYARMLRVLPYGALRLARRAADVLLPVSDDKISFEYKVKRMLEGSLLPPEESHFYWNGSLSGRQRQLVYEHARGGVVSGEVAETLSRLNVAGPLNNLMYLDQKFYLPDDILSKVDRMSMAHSIEVRPPLLDHRIIEFAARLPQHLKISGATGKVVMRALMADKLPQSVLKRAKMGFDVPAHDWFRTFLKPLLLDVLSPENVASTGVLRPSGVERLVSDHLNRRANLGYQLWGLVTLLLWMKRWNIQAPETAAAATGSVFASS